MNLQSCHFPHFLLLLGILKIRIEYLQIPKIWSYIFIKNDFLKDSLSNRVHLVSNLEFTCWKFSRAVGIRVSLLFVSENVILYFKTQSFPSCMFSWEYISPKYRWSNLVHSVLFLNFGKCIVWRVVIFRLWYLS